MTPEQIRTRVFETVKKNGLDPGEVQEFLLDTAREVEQLYAEIDTLKVRSANAEQQRDAIMQDLTRLKDAPAKTDDASEKVVEVLAELKKTSDELVEHSKINAAAFAMRAEQERKVLFDQAKKQAEIVIRDAEKKADAIIDRALAKVQDYRDDISILQARRIAIISRVKSLLVSQQQFLESLEKDAIGQSQELTDIVKASGEQAGVSAEQLQTILDKLEEHQGNTE